MVASFARICLLFLALCGGHALATDEEPADNWPREIDIKDGVGVLYQPQPEKLDGNVLKGRAAVSVELASREQPVFGAIWLSAELRIDRSERMANMIDLEIDNIRIPEEDADKANALAGLIERELPKMNIPFFTACACRSRYMYKFLFMCRSTITCFVAYIVG